MMVFPTVNEATRIWIKGDNFSVESLLGDDELAGRFWDGSLAIFRLAPQDYHRFHFPVDGTIVDLREPIGTNYFTVNPMAIRSPVDVVCYSFGAADLC
jgi:phosphatidylserine decarboxylase